FNVTPSVVQKTSLALSALAAIFLIISCSAIIFLTFQLILFLVVGKHLKGACIGCLWLSDFTVCINRNILCCSYSMDNTVKKPIQLPKSPSSVLFFTTSNTF